MTHGSCVRQVPPADVRMNSWFAMIPRVSVLMSVYNGERYLREAIDSILGQTFTDFEFIVVDDASTDHSFEIASAYTDPRIVRVRNEVNLGLTASLNRGLELARGEYVARMDCDDISLPERLARQVAHLDANPDVGACSTWAFDIDEAGKVLGKRETPVGEQLENFYWRESLIHPAAMFRFSPEAGPRYSPAVRYSQDYDLWLRIRARHRLSNLPEYLLLYRVRESGITLRNRERQMRSAHHTFSEHVWGGPVPYETFLTLMGYKPAISPLRRALATIRLAKRIGKPFRIFIADNLKYAREWYLPAGPRAILRR